MSKSKTNWDRLKRMSDEEIQAGIDADPDAFLPDADFWKEATIVMPSKDNKLQITLRIDKDVLEFFKQSGRGYQGRMNAVLRSYVEALQRHA